jgi:hypothetical protein
MKEVAIFISKSERSRLTCREIQALIKVTVAPEVCNFLHRLEAAIIVLDKMKFSHQNHLNIFSFPQGLDLRVASSRFP